MRSWCRHWRAWSSSRLASKSDEQKRALALERSFDRLEHPEKALLEHYVASSDPLNKYLVAGPWGHQYLKGRGIDMVAFEAFDKELYELLGCGDGSGREGSFSWPMRASLELLDRLKGEAN